MIDQILSWTSLPNLHPALVHFPIALIPVALATEIGHIFFRKQKWLTHAATGLYILAAIGAIVAIWAGERAADGLANVPAAVQPVIARHSDWAHYAAWAIGLGAALRIGIAWRRRTSDPLGLSPHLALASLSLVTLGLLGYVADLGGSLVFSHGLGVEVAADKQDQDDNSGFKNQDIGTEAQPTGDHSTNPVAARLERSSGGGLRWRPSPSDNAALKEIISPAPGFSQDVVSWLQPSPPQGLTLAVDGRSLLVFPDTFSDVQVDATLDITGFEGTIGVAHHVAETGHGGFFTLSTKGAASLYETQEGDTKQLDQGSVQLPSKTFTMAVSAVGKHLKGLLDGKTVTHGHLSPASPGKVGILLDGKGPVRIIEMVVTPVKEH